MNFSKKVMPLKVTSTTCLLTL